MRSVTAWFAFSVLFGVGTSYAQDAKPNIVLIFVYVRIMNRLDRRYGHGGDGGASS